MKIETDIVEFVLHRMVPGLFQSFFTKLELKLMKEINDLKSAVQTTLAAAVETIKQQDNATKAALDAAATTINGLTADKDALTAENTKLKADLAAAQGTALPAEDVATLVELTSNVQSAAQTLTDTAAANAASN